MNYMCNSDTYYMNYISEITNSEEIFDDLKILSCTTYLSRGISLIF